jgi:hypothetical protein
VLFLQAEEKKEFVAWEHYLSKNMRRHGQVETVLKVANRFGRTRSRQSGTGGTSFSGFSGDGGGGGTASSFTSVMNADIDTQHSWSDTVMKPRWH